MCAYVVLDALAGFVQGQGQMRGSNGTLWFHAQENLASLGTETRDRHGNATILDTLLFWSTLFDKDSF